MLAAPNDDNDLCLLQKIFLTTVWNFIEVVFHGDSSFRLWGSFFVKEGKCFLPGGHPFQVGSAVDRMLHSQDLVPYGHMRKAAKVIVKSSLYVEITRRRIEGRLRS
ncbi:hypothetical protein SADUNF_Sadunf18G0059500 [Salix dunnii]|uniref:Uncharacterized protein n=1 Tax=Salix dunnii TaxID=1413687 RepID=A0A835J5P3_9ROSI|nr:hypothetical protein SADUNF_Sadunf18G0059500 [Salix dunnii]